MDTSTAEKIIETNYDIKYSKYLRKVLNDEQKNVDESIVDTNSITDVSSHNNSVSIEAFPKPPKNRIIYTESIHSWFIGKVTEVFRDDGYFVAKLRDIDTGIISVAEFDIESAFDDENDVNLKLFPGASFAFYVFTKHGMGSPLTSTGLEFNSPHIWQEKDNEKLKEIYDETFPEESS